MEKELEATTASSLETRKSQHPGLHSILDKLHRGIGVTADEVEQMRRHVQMLEECALTQHDEKETVGPLAPVPSGKIIGHATREGTRRFAARAGEKSMGFYRSARDLFVSSIGIGTYRGAMDHATDAGYATALLAAMQAGVNVIDTSLNYRHQRSERAVAAALHRFIESSGGKRDEIVVCTKGGFLVPGAITDGTIGANDVVGGTHSIAPAFLADQLDRSRRNLGLETIDVYYLHNPETQLKFVPMPEFIKRIRAAFVRLEQAVSDGSIQYYGTATWDGYRSGALSLPALVKIAREIAGDEHRFRFLQLPLNLGMQEARMNLMGGASVLDTAVELGVTVIASASLLQGRLSRDLPEQFVRMMPTLDTDAQRSIQFTRSTPGIASALVGMSRIAHVTENVAVAQTPPLTVAEFQRLCSTVF